MNNYRETLISGGVNENQLLIHENIPSWCQDNEYILNGYRECDRNFKFYFKSIFQLHNETLNIWTHLTGALLFIFLGIYTYSEHLMDSYWGDLVAISIFLFTVIFCFTASFIMHCWYPMSENTCNCLLKADYFGISLLIS